MQNFCFTFIHSFIHLVGLLQCDDSDSVKDGCLEGIRICSGLMDWTTRPDERLKNLADVPERNATLEGMLVCVLKKFESGLECHL